MPSSIKSMSCLTAGLKKPGPSVHVLASGIYRTINPLSRAWATVCERMTDFPTPCWPSINAILPVFSEVDGKDGIMGSMRLAFSKVVSVRNKVFSDGVESAAWVFFLEGGNISGSRSVLNGLTTAVLDPSEAALIVSDRLWCRRHGVEY